MKKSVICSVVLTMESCAIAARKACSRSETLAAACSRTSCAAGQGAGEKGSEEWGGRAVENEL